MEIRNKKASFDYTIKDTFTAGIQLFGMEIKSIRDGKASLSESFCYFVGNELFMKNSYIAPYECGWDRKNYNERRDRKLLLNRSELNKLAQQVKTKGVTIVPLKMFINDHGLCKVLVATAVGKKNYDKRESIKEKDIDRQKKRELSD